MTGFLRLGALGAACVFSLTAFPSVFSGMIAYADDDVFLRPATLTETMGGVSLKDVETLDLKRFNEPITSQDTPGADIPIWIERVLRNNAILPYKSPSDAMLTLHCESFDCTKIVAQIALRSQGGVPNSPVLWRHEESVFKYKWLPYYKRESEDIAKSIVGALLEDYAQARGENFKTVSQSAAPSRIEPTGE